MTLFTNTEKLFEEARKIYPGIKRGFDTEFKNFKKHKDFEAVVTTLKQAIENQIKYKELKKKKNEFAPDWKHLKTWVNNRCWEEEIPSHELMLKKIGAEELHKKVKTEEKKEPYWNPALDTEYQNEIKKLARKWSYAK
jgi:hypothetical protein